MSTGTTEIPNDAARARLPRAAQTAARWMFHAMTAAWVVRRGIGTGDMIGIPWGEQWGRLFVTAQVTRWFHGTTPGWADLMAAPEGRRFWPVDPLVQAVAVPVFALLGEPTGWAIVLGSLSLVAGLGGASLARAAGADAPRAAAVGLLLQLNPFWLRQGAEGVTEALSTGFVALTLAFAWQLLRGGEADARIKRGNTLGFSLSWAAVCLTSPYHALYAAGVGSVILPFWPAAPRATLARLGAIAALVGVVSAAPLIAAETGDRGRLTAAWTGGYRLIPDELVRVQRGPKLEAVLVPAKPPSFGQDAGDIGRKQVPGWARFLVPWPGGFPVAALLAIGLARPQTRRISLFGAAFFLLGPAWGPIVRAVGLPQLPAPLEAIFAHLPVTRLLGNINRSVVVPLLIAAGIGGSSRGRVGTVAIAVAAVAAAWVETPGLSLPVTEISPPTGLYAAIDGPTAVFPSGDPPVWNPGPWPKENLWLAGHHHGPQAYDYGRGGEPADATLQVRLSEVAGIPLGRGAAERHSASDATIWRELHAAGFTRVLVVRRTLPDAAWERVYRYLTEQVGPPIRSDASGGVWAIATAPLRQD
jgi:hypothetical protein